MSEASPRRVLVTGATGQQGQAFIRAIKHSPSPGYSILALTRNPASPSAKALQADDVRLVQGDLDDAESIRRVFDDAGGVGAIYGLLCTLQFPGMGKDGAGELKQGKILADLALDYKVQHFVYSSAERGGTTDDHVPAVDRKAKVDIESYVMSLGEKGLPWTVIRPAFFMENFLGTLGKVTVTVLRAGLKKDVKVNLVAVRDIGSVAVAVFENPAKTRGKVLSIISDRLTMPELEAAYQKGAGSVMPSFPNFVGRSLRYLNADIGHLLSDITRISKRISDPIDGSYAPTRDLTHEVHPGMTSFEAWSRDVVNGPGTDSVGADRRDGWNGVTWKSLFMGQK